MSLKCISRREFWGLGFQIRFISNVSQMHFTLKFAAGLSSDTEDVIFSPLKRTLISDSEVELCRYQTHSLSPQKCSSCWISHKVIHIFLSKSKRSSSTLLISHLCTTDQTLCAVSVWSTPQIWPENSLVLQSDRLLFLHCGPLFHFVFHVVFLMCLTRVWLWCGFLVVVFFERVVCFYVYSMCVFNCCPGIHKVSWIEFQRALLKRDPGSFIV